MNWDVNKNSCIACPSNQIWNNKNNRCECSQNSHWDSRQQKCVQCYNNLVWNSQIGACGCQAGYILFQGSCAIIPTCSS